MWTPLSSRARRSSLVFVALLGGALAACSASETSYADAAKKLIEGDLAKKAGLGKLTATCEKPLSTEVGEEFACTAETEDGQTIDFTSTIEAKDKVDVSSNNLINASVLPLVVDAARNALADEVGVDLDPDSLDCGTQSVILDEAGQMVCTFISPESGDEYDATITITDLTTGDLTIKIADRPR